MADIILAGATGLTGGLLVPMLVEQGHRLTIITRRSIDGLPTGVEQIVSAVGEWPEEISKRGFDLGISCLGTTAKKAASKAAFRAIDLELTRDFAVAVQKAGAKKFIAISSPMANSRSRSFYFKTKGEAEDALRALDFYRLDLIRPGLLKGVRQEFRLGEDTLILLSPILDYLLPGKLDKFRSIYAADVARGIAKLAASQKAGIFAHYGRDLKKLAGL